MEKKGVVLGISAYKQGSAAVLVADGEITAAAREERFSRVMGDSAFPVASVRYVLKEAGVEFGKVDAIVLDDPLPAGGSVKARWRRFVFQMRVLWMLKQFGRTKAPLLFPEHLLPCTANAFFPSPFERAAILTINETGTAICVGNKAHLRIIRETGEPSAAVLYRAFADFLGFGTGGELEGLALYGDAFSDQTQLFKEKITDELVEMKEDGAIVLDMYYFDAAAKPLRIHVREWELLFGIPQRARDGALTGGHANFASAACQVLTTIITRLAETVKMLTEESNLVMAGEVFSSCAANNRTIPSKLFKNIWIQPVAGAAGSALGAALAGHHVHLERRRMLVADADRMCYTCLGPEYAEQEIEAVLTRCGARYRHFKTFDELASVVSWDLAGGQVVGWFQGRMEFGTEGLGNRSVLADARNPKIQKALGLKTKRGEGFVPFGASVLAEDASRWFPTVAVSPYKTTAFLLHERHRLPEVNPEEDIFTRLYRQRSSVPAVTCVDYSVRVQTVSEESNKKLWTLLNCFKKLTQTGLLANTAFQIGDRPMACTPEDAYNDFLYSELDCLVMGNFLLYHNKQLGVGGKVNQVRKQGEQEDSKQT
ncbi:putative carbamoyl transferase, NodU family [Bacteroidales bacterium Barb6XT]|nr:putative carbamoyl transferase, NodU family [Bacteroidales bacterium Barb6XT]